MITVYFEKGSHAEMVATFETEELYVDCLPTLQRLATNAGCTLTESVSDNECWVNVYRAPYAGCTNAALYYTSLGYATKGDALAALDSPKSKNIRDRFIKTTSINL